MSDFEHGYRTLSMDAIKLSKTTNCRGLQQPNVEVARQLSDTCYTVLRATKAFFIMGSRIMVDPSDEEARANASSISKGLMDKMKKIADMVSVDAPVDPKWMMDQSLVSTYQKHFDASVTEVTDSLNEYSAAEGSDPCVIPLE
jgi:alkanesulfonate monooxygenase SsuD/methylene tetrahydromethanopterin reductase-like flavin-dependent oxidoreductase (luciferase family)